MTCPMCQRPTEQKWRPFCSKRCADLDLGKWVTGSYAIPTDDSADDADAPPLPDRNTDPTRRH